MKKLCAVLLACILLLSGCSSFVRGFVDGMSRAKSTPAVFEGKGVLGDFEVEIIGAKAVKSFDGKPAVTITYHWTNNSDQTESFMTAFQDEVFQDGIQLQMSMMDSSEADLDMTATLDIKPGKSLDITQAYELRNDSKTIEVEVSIFSVGNEPIVKKTFTLD